VAVGRSAPRREISIHPFSAIVASRGERELAGIVGIAAAISRADIHVPGCIASSMACSWGWIGLVVCFGTFRTRATPISKPIRPSDASRSSVARASAAADSSVRGSLPMSIRPLKYRYATLPLTLEDARVFRVRGRWSTS
jgi:hypothetical protein